MDRDPTAAASSQDRQTAGLRALAGPATAFPETSPLVEPQLRDLMSLNHAAATLPSWTRAIQARQSGAYLSSLKGRGMEYSESRPYQPGDDVRTLDWRVTARTGKSHTKLFREERERPVYLCVDYRRAMFFATRGVFKAVQAARAASLLAWKAQQNGDRVGGVVFAEHGHHELSPGRGKPAAIRFLKQLVAAAPGARAAATPVSTAFPAAIARLRRLARPGSLLFVFSDFRGFDPACQADLTYLARHNDLLLVLVHDPLEAELPAIGGRYRVTDGQREVELVADDDSRRATYRERFAARTASVSQFCRAHRLMYAAMSTTAEPLHVLLRALGRH